MATTLALTALFILTVGFTRGRTDTRDYEQSWRYSHQAAKKYRKQRDHLQVLLTARVLQARQLTGEITKLRRALKADLALPGPSSLERSFMCIHRFEGSWTDPDAPYYGGLQMDLEFQRTYGPEYLRAWGTADHWPVSVQIAVAIKAYLTRGFNPWPNTARDCGLL